MSDRLELSAQPRSVVGRQVKHLRAQGWVPAVLYGYGIESQPLQVGAKELADVLHQGGASRLIALRDGQNGGEARMILVRDIQRDPVRRTLLHVDLYQVVMTEKLFIEVPIVLVGESSVEDDTALVLTQARQTIEVECLPGDIPDQIEVDISALAAPGDAVFVRDLTAPPNTAFHVDEDEVIISVGLTRAAVEEDEEEEEISEFDEAEVEVVGRGREAEDEDEADREEK